MKLVVLLLATGLASVLLTGLMRRYAIRRNVLDIPNARSSHSVPTPRGGGLSIVFSFAMVLPLLAWLEWIPVSLAVALVFPGLLVAAVGFLDDHGHIPARWRLLGHFGCAAFIVAVLGGLPHIEMFGEALTLGWFGFVVALIGLVWLLNLYNFMDGIDGLAGVEAVTSCAGAALATLVMMGSGSASAWEGALPALFLAAASFGFLVWNFPPAKIFMGDGGSGFLGLMLGALAVHGAHLDARMLWIWLILLGVFVVDSTVTLLRRLLRGERIYEAHRSHAYQYASRALGAHRPVTVATLMINLIWLLPVALGVAVGALDGFLALVVAYTPLVALALYYQAGAAEQPPGRAGGSSRRN